MNVCKPTLSALFLLLFTHFICAQSLPEVERELASLAKEVLTHDSLEYKIKQNKAFSRLLINTLKRPESFKYNFDSLETVSILRADDNSFRIFTWHIVDRNRSEYYGEQFHYFFGLVQRKYVNETGATEYLVIPLLEMADIPRGVENMVLTNNQWLGALYYYPKNHNRIKSYTFKYDDPRVGGQVKSTYYVLLGWNGNDLRSNFKVVDAMSFDPNDKSKILFGANVFYFDIIAKHRALFFYSEYAPFSLNTSFVKSGPFKLFKKEMIVYDHLARPNNAGRELTTVFELGPDGSYDGLLYSKAKGGFVWKKNVVLAEKFNTKMTRRMQAEMRNEERKRLKAAGIDLSND